MAILHSPDSAYAKEMTKWEAQGSTMGPGLRPYIFRQFPMMMHLAGSLPQGGLGILEQVIVEDEEAATRAHGMGFRDTPLNALDAYQAQQLEYAKLAAERNYERRRMSPQANAEIDRAEDVAGAVHLPSVPVTPIKRRRSQRSMK